MEDKNYENPQNEAHEENTFRLKEDTHSSHVWYWIIAILILILFGWYGYSAGWFSKTNKVTPKPIAEQKENQNPFSEKDLADIKARIEYLIDNGVTKFEISSISHLGLLKDLKRADLISGSQLNLINREAINFFKMRQFKGSVLSVEVSRNLLKSIAKS